MRTKLLRAIDRICGHLSKIADSLRSPQPGDPVARDHDQQSQSLHDIAIAASAALEECEQECDALRMIKDAAWMAYWDYESP